MFKKTNRKTNIDKIALTKTKRAQYNDASGKRVTTTMRIALKAVATRAEDEEVKEAENEFFNRADVLEYVIQAIQGTTPDKAPTAWFQSKSGCRLLFRLKLAPDGVAVETAELDKRADPFQYEYEKALDVIDSVVAEGELGLDAMRSLRSARKLGEALGGKKHNNEIMAYLNAL